MGNRLFQLNFYQIKIEIHPLSDLREAYMDACMTWIKSKRPDLIIGPMPLEIYLKESGIDRY